MNFSRDKLFNDFKYSIINLLSMIVNSSFSFRKYNGSSIAGNNIFKIHNDGIHDTWRILGIREDFQPNSRVYIFDRYGKLLKELDPVGEGWDGTFIGRPMPQSDYWFRVFLEDGREFKGHFSLVRGFD